MASVSILHLSDIHIGNFIYDDDIESLAFKICEGIQDAHKSVEAVVITGDVFDAISIKNSTDKGERNIDLAINFFVTLLEVLQEDINKEIKREDFVFVPGNHDVLRTDEGPDFSIYEKFLKKFYGADLYNSIYRTDNFVTLKIFKNSKIALLGLNSCNLKKDIDSINKANDCLKNISFKDIAIDADLEAKIKEKFIKEYINNNEEWFDYGEISKHQMRLAKQKLKEEILNNNDYVIIAAFHHHLISFPEIYKGNGDVSQMHNSSEVIDFLQRNNINIVLHGHKHMPLIRPIANDQYLNNPNSIIYVLTAGSIGKKDIQNRMFEIVKVFDKSERNKKAEIYQFKYNGEQLEEIKPIYIPPKKRATFVNKLDLKTVLKEECDSKYNIYIDKISDNDLVSPDMDIDRIIQCVENSITPFLDIQEQIYDNIDIILYILLTIHYRINAFNNYKKGLLNNDFLNRLASFFKDQTSLENDFLDIIFNFLNKINSKEQKDDYIKLREYKNRNCKVATGFIVVTCFLTDLYLALSRYSDVYFDKISYKVNIKMDKDTFHKKIPKKDNIIIFSNEERRGLVVKFRSKDPTCHKIAVLLLKDFEFEMTKFEESFNDINLKIFYILPDISKEGYDLENYNFEAYIPALLPLLIGKNLYKQEEVFIRELIQNATDAILLRKQLVDDGETIDECIKIVTGRETLDNIVDDGRAEPVKYLQIIDNGVGWIFFTLKDTSPI